MIETKLEGKTADIGEKNIKKLKAIFPEVFIEGKVDFDKLKQVLGDYVEDNNERYNFTWNGKGRALRLSQTPSLGTLRPCKEESKNWDTTENLYIEGDNLEVLKLLQKSYYGKVKMIYIDPPYNTGKDFVYKDDFHDSLENYKRITGQVDGNGNRLSTNTEASGRYHTNWLNMMYPRLRLARNLLSDDGVIFISIDDNEVDNLKKICNEVFGEDNFVADVIMRSNPRGSQEPFGISREHEYLICYVKSTQGIFSIVGQEREDDDSEFNFTLETGKKARLLGLRKRGGDWRRSDRPNMFFPLYVNPNDNSVRIEKSQKYHFEVLPLRPDGEESRWTWGIETAKERIAELYGKEITRNGEKTFDIYRIDPLESPDGSIKREKFKSVWLDKELNYQSARQYLRKLFGNSEIFDFPKPPEMIIKLLGSLNENGGLTLDFFSGSATTAHAVMQLNAEDGGNRKFIMVQLPEPTDEKSEAYKAGYMNISEIGKERIRRAGDQILELSLKNLEKEGLIEKIELGAENLELEQRGIGKDEVELPKVNSLEESDGASGNCIPSLRETAQSGTLFTTGSDEAGGGVDTQQYSRGTGQGNQGIYTIFKNSPGQQGGSGNTVVALRTIEILERYGYRISPEFINGNKQNDCDPDKKSKLSALNSQLSNDIGFKVLKLDTSNIRKWQPDRDNLEQSLLDYVDNYVEGRTELDVVYEIMLKYGLDLTYPVDEFKIAQKKVYSIGFGMLMICLDNEITTEVAKGIIAKAKELKPEENTRVVFKDNGFKTDSNKTNVKEIFKSAGIEEFITL